MKYWLKYQVPTLIIGTLVIWCGYGHNLFDSNNKVWGFFSGYGDVKVPFDGEMLRRFWIIHDADKYILKALICVTAFVALAVKIPGQIRVGLASVFLILGLSNIWDSLQVLIWQNSHKFAGVEIAAISLSFLFLCITVEIIPINSLNKKYAALNRDVAFIFNDTQSWSYKIRAGLYRLFGRKTDKMITFQKLSSDIQAAEIENDMLKEMLDNKEPISDEELRKIMVAIHDNSNDIQNWLVMWGTGHNEKAKDAVANIAEKIAQWSDRSMKKIDEKTEE